MALNTIKPRLCRSRVIHAAHNLLDAQARKAALACVPKVCRTASTLYELFAYYRLIGAASKHAPEGKMTGWGSAMRRAIGNWFLEKKPMDVAMQVG